MSETRDIVTTPHGILADRVWGGMHYHYPGIERLVAELLRLRTENATLRAECGAARTMIGKVLFFDRSDERQIEKHAQEDALWDAWQAARTATNQLCPEWAKENP